MCKFSISFEWQLQFFIVYFDFEAKKMNLIYINIYLYGFFVHRDTQTILTIQNHVITKNHRISLLHSEHKTWQLKIKDIRESDRGFYMCQMNTVSMKSR